MKYRKRPIVVEAIQMTSSRYWQPVKWPVWLQEAWEKDRRWGALRNQAEFKKAFEEQRERIGPIYGSLWHFPGW